MTEEPKRLNPVYSGAVRFALIEQLLLLLLTWLMLDEGMTVTIFMYSAAAYWLGFGIIMVRRSLSPGKYDILFVIMDPEIWTG